MDVVIRQAREEDRAAVIEVESKSTPNLRYIPQVFDMFMADQPGEFLVAEADGGLVGCAKFTVVPDGSAWLETLRVIPACQGMGIGKRFYERFFDIARRLGVTKMRMYTGLGNMASKGLAERFGFQIAAARKGAWLVCEPGVSDTLLPVDSFNPITSIATAIELLMPLAKQWEHFLVMNRTFFTLTAALCADLVEKRQVYHDPLTGSVVTLGARFMPQSALHIGVFGGDAAACLGFALQQGIASGASRLSCLFPASDTHLQQIFTGFGFQFERSDFIVMETGVDN